MSDKEMEEDANFLLTDKQELISNYQLVMDVLLPPWALTIKPLIFKIHVDIH